MKIFAWVWVGSSIVAFISTILYMAIIDVYARAFIVGFIGVLGFVFITSHCIVYIMDNKP